MAPGGTFPPRSADNSKGYWTVNSSGSTDTAALLEDVAQVSDEEFSDWFCRRHKVGGWYLDYRMEVCYMLHLTGGWRFYATTIIALVMTLFWASILFAALSKDDPSSPSPTQLSMYVAIPMAVVNLLYGVGNYLYTTARVGKAKRWTTSDQGLFLYRAETITSFLMVLGSIFFFAGFERDDRCRAYSEPRGMRNFCPQIQMSIILRIVPAPLIMVAVRPVQAIPQVAWCVVLGPISYVILLHASAHADTALRQTMFVVPIILFGALICAALLVQDNRRRQDFEDSLRRKRVANAIAFHHRRMRRTLAAVLPDDCLLKFTRGEPIIDQRAHCTIGVTRIFDYPVWSSAYIQAVYINLVDYLHTRFDRQLNVLQCEKILETDELYIFSAGLRRPSIQRSTCADAMSVLRFSKLQLNIVETLHEQPNAPKLFSDATARKNGAPRLAIGVGTGGGLGTFIGSTKLLYGVVGEAMGTAESLVKAAGPDQLLVSKATWETCNNQSNAGDPLLEGESYSPQLSSPGVSADSSQPREDACDNNKQRDKQILGSAYLVTKVSKRIDRPVELPSSSSFSSPPKEEDREAEYRTDELVFLTQQSIQQQRTRQNISPSDDANGSDTQQQQQGLERSEEEEESKQSPSDSLRSVPPVKAPDGAAKGEIEFPTDCCGKVFPSFSPQCEAAYHAAQERQASQSARPLAYLMYFVTAVVVLLDMVFEFKAEAAPASLLGATFFVIAVRAVSLVLLRDKNSLLSNQWVDFALQIGICALLTTSILLTPESMFNDCNVTLQNTMLPLILLIGLTRIPWVMLGSTVLVLNAVTLYFTVHKEQLLDELRLPGMTALLFVWAAWDREMSRRRAFVDEYILAALRQDLEQQLLWHRGLLHMLVPDFIVDQVVEKPHGGKCITMFFNNAVLLDVRFPAVDDAAILSSSVGPAASCGRVNVSFSEGPDMVPIALQKLQARFSLIERLLDGRVPYSRLVGMVHVVGDTVRFAGPMLQPSEEEVSSSPKELKSIIEMRRPRTAMLEQDVRLADAMNAGRAAVGLLHVVAGLARSCPKLTALLACESGICAVLGSLQPSYEVCGVIARTLAAGMQAAPESGFVGATERFLQLIYDEDANRHLDLPGLSNSGASQFGAKSPYDKDSKENLNARRCWPSLDLYQPRPTLNARKGGGDTNAFEVSRDQFVAGDPLHWRVRGVGYLNVVPLQLHQRGNQN